ncbi:MAG: GIY-YIG nuclease family protein [Myxococcota bacterium]
MSERQWRVYLLQCGDGSYYCGIAKDVKARLAEHAAGKGAKYTRGRGPLELLAKSVKLSYSQALKAEHRIKGLKKEDKQKAVRRLRPVL